MRKPVRGRVDPTRCGLIRCRPERGGGGDGATADRSEAVCDKRHAGMRNIARPSRGHHRPDGVGRAARLHLGIGQRGARLAAASVFSWLAAGDVWHDLSDVRLAEALDDRASVSPVLRLCRIRADARAHRLCAVPRRVGATPCRTMARPNERDTAGVILSGHNGPIPAITPAWHYKCHVVGLLANTYIESTARYAMELGLHVTLIRDATAAFSMELMHAAHVLNGPPVHMRS
jgi:isochorismatase family protein